MVKRRSALVAWVIAPLVTLGGCATSSGVVAGPSPATETVTKSSGEVGDRPSRDAQVVEVDGYGISFELPKAWMTLDAKEVLDSSNPVFEEVAARMGMTSQQFVESIGASVLTFSITDRGAVRGFVDNVNSVGMSRSEFSDDRIKLQLATIGAKPARFEHATSAAGDVIRVPYRWRITGTTVHGVLILVDVGDAATQITVSSHAAGTADKLADRIQRSLRTTR